MTVSPRLRLSGFKVFTPPPFWGIFLDELNNFYYSLPKVKKLGLTEGEGSLKILIG